MTKSRFSGLLQPKKATPTKPRKKSPKPAAAAPVIAPSETQTREVIVLRAVGKRSKDNYTQVSAYVPKDLHKRVKGALIDDGRDFSELVSDLLDEWLQNRE
jgi:hypothetical protein